MSNIQLDTKSEIAMYPYPQANLEKRVFYRVVDDVHVAAVRVVEPEAVTVRLQGSYHSAGAQVGAAVQVF